MLKRINEQKSNLDNNNEKELVFTRIERILWKKTKFKTKKLISFNPEEYDILEGIWKEYLGTRLFPSVPYNEHLKIRKSNGELAKIAQERERYF